MTRAQKWNGGKNKKNKQGVQTHGGPDAWMGTVNPPRLRIPEGRTFQFAQTLVGTTIVQTPVTAVFGSYGFQFGFLDQSASFAAIFDEYRVDWLQITFRPLANTAVMISPTTAIQPQLVTAVDTDDATAPTAFSQLREYNSAQNSVFETQVRTFRPGMTDSNGLNHISPWCDMAITNIPHFGVKWGVEGGASGQTLVQTWDITFRVVVTLRHIR